MLSYFSIAQIIRLLLEEQSMSLCWKWCIALAGRISGEIRMLIDVYSAVPYRNLSHTAGYPQKNAFQAFKAANGNDC